MTLRADLFRTVERAETRFIAFRDTITPSNEDFSIMDLDLKDARKGRFGCGVHFLVLPNGDVQLGRAVNTVGAHSKDYDRVSVAVGIVGGLCPETNKRLYTRTPEQEEALEHLLDLLSKMYPGATLNDRPGVLTHP